MIISVVLFWIAFTGPDWIKMYDEDNDEFDIACGVISYCADVDRGEYKSAKCNGSGERYGSALSDIPIVWWRWTAVLAGIGLVILILCCIGALVTLIPAAQHLQIWVHNTSALSIILILVGLILFCVGFEEMGADDGRFEAPCKFCGDKTSAFVLENCNMGRDLIINIVAVILVSLTCCLGYSVSHSQSQNLDG